MKILFLKIETKRWATIPAAFVLMVLLACGGGKKDQTGSMENMEGMEHGRHNGVANEKNVAGTAPSTYEPEMNKPNDHSAHADSLLDIAPYVLPVNRQVISSQKTIVVKPDSSARLIKALGYIALDERRSNKVSAWFSGRIEKLYIRYNLQHVRKGEKILDLYSAELNTYQEELLFLLKRDSDASLVEKAREKLRLLGLTASQISRIEKTGETFFSISIYSPQEGYVLFAPSSPAEAMGDSGMSAGSNSVGMGSGMNAGDSKTPSFPTAISTRSNQIREGDYVRKGQTLFQVNDIQQVWAMLAVDNRHQQMLRQGMPVVLKSELYPGETIHAKIDLIEPAYQKNQKFILSRVYLKNPGGKYKINSLVEGEIVPAKINAVTVPYSSVLFLGKRKIVWVMKGKTAGGNKIFEARNVITGIVLGDQIVIKAGLNQGEEIALNAGYLLDREGLIQPE